MKNNITTKIILVFFASSLLFSCSKKNNDIDFDFSTLKKSKKVNEKKIESKVKYGKKDPFSGGSQVNKLDLNLKLTGFLNTNNNKYAFVRYLNNKGTITEASIGGVNTNLLPNGAKVINIDPKNMKLTIKFENEDYVFEL